MIISEQKYDAVQKREKRTVFLGVIFLLGICIWLFFPLSQKQSVAISSRSIFCDAEKVDGEQFVSGDFHFGGGQLQSDERAHSGQYSCKTKIGKGIQYGFQFQLKNCLPGEVYKVSVWRYKTPQKDGRLVIQNSGGTAFYQMEEIPVKVEESGWEKLETSFLVPFGEKPNFYNIYVYAGGFRSVFFDDLKIERTSTWAENTFHPRVLDLKIEAKALRKLETKREEALLKGLLQVGDKDWVKGIITDSTLNEIPIKLRLKGDWTDHLQGNKWSFRIKAKDGFSWQATSAENKSLTTFSVHNPTTRYFLSEWLVHQFWKQEGVLTTDYDFTEVKLNGKSLGLYAIEEHFEKQLVESQQRREGVIVKFSEEGMWAGIDRQLQNHGYIQHESRGSISQWENTSIEAFGQNKISKSPTLSKQYETARELMFAYQNGLKPADEIFDLDKLARYYAIADIFNAYHGIIWHNQRFYFNPVLGKLEPIGFDAFGGKPPRRYGILAEGAMNPNQLEANPLFGYLLQDTTFNALYFKYLYDFSSRDYLSNFLGKNQIKWSKRLALLQLEFPDYKPDYKDFLTEGLFVHSLILPFKNFSLKAFTEKITKGKKVLKVQNTHQLPIEILGFGYSQKMMDSALEIPLLLPPHIRRRYLSQVLRDGSIKDFKTSKYLHAQALALQQKGEFRDIKVSENARFLFFKLPGIDSVFTSTISKNSFIGIPKFKASNQASFSDLITTNLFEVQGKKILFRQGKHLISQPLIFPKGYEIFIKEGTEFDFINQSYLMSYAAMQVFGSEEKPVLFTSSDKTGKGISILQASKPSIFKHVIFNQLGTLDNKSQQLTGAVTAYETHINFYRCAFQNNFCEDALNLVRSDFVLEKCHFSNTSSDAFDSDFCKGEVNNCTFTNIANDGMDFSGSVVTIKNCSLDNCGDKGISAGEESDISVLDSKISYSPTAVASKDLSTLFLRNISIKNCDQAFVAFQKKPEFGPGYIVVESYTVENVKRLKAIGVGSFLQISQ